METAVLGKLTNNKDFSFPFEGLKKHFIALGSSGSGKTVLCKAIIEEAAKNKIPAIIVDPQGDLASLALAGEGNEKLKDVQVVIFTPTSSKGIPLAINPLKLPKASLEKEDLVSVLGQISSSIASLLGYNLEKDSGKAAQSVLYTILHDAYSQKTELGSFEDLAFLIESMQDNAKKELLSLISENGLKDLVKKIRYLTVGEKELLFNFGVPIDIDVLFGKNEKEKNAEEKKTRISVIYLNTLGSQADKDFFVSMLATELYKWMLSNPSKDIQGLFYIDEISPYLPAGALKPLPKPILTLLFKQARKYSIGCIVSTQNPGDIDYRAFAQFGTWAIGRLTTKQDQAKVKDALKSLAGEKITKIIGTLPKLKPGSFMFFSPDYFEDIVEVKVRRLITEHKTLTENDVKKITDEEKLRDVFKTMAVEKKHEKKTVVEGIVVKEKQGTMHFPVNLDLNSAKWTADKNKKKKFMFGQLETVASVELVFEPLLRAKIKTVKQGFWKKGLVDYDVVFNGKTGEIMVFSGKKFWQTQGFSNLLKLTDAQIKALKVVSGGKMQTSAIAGVLGITPSAANKTLHELLDEKLVQYTRSKNFYIWFGGINLPKKIKKVASGMLDLADKKENAKMLKPLVSAKDIAAAARAWFDDAEIVEFETIYYPVYEATLVEKDKTRKISISGVNGDIL